MKLHDTTIKFISEFLTIGEATPPFGGARAFEEEPLQRTYQASFALSAQAPLLNFADVIEANAPRAFKAGFGFVSVGDRLKDVRNGSAETTTSIENLGEFIFHDGFTFGVSVAFDPEPSTKEENQTLLGSLQLPGSKYEFPIIATPSALKRHNIPNPGTPSKIGSSACWVKPIKPSNQNWSHGVMVSRHVVDNLSLGSNVSLDDPSGFSSISAKVADLGACTIDAAILDVRKFDWPNNLRRLKSAGPYSNPLAPGTDIQMQGRHTNGLSGLGKVLNHNPLRGYWGSMVSQWLEIDVCGQPGDSGALVQLKNIGDGVGVHIGEIKDGGGGFNGICQDLHQASVYLSAEMYLA